MNQPNLQTQYNLILEGKGNKEQFLKQARSLFPNYLTLYQDFNTSVAVLKGKSIITENNIKPTTSNRVEDFAAIFKKSLLESEVKSEEKETSKEVLDKQDNAYDNKDKKNIDNLNFNEVLKGFYLEMSLPENKDKNPDQLKLIVAKNLAKDPLYYTKDGMFGVKGVGFTDEAPSLGKPVDAKGEHKSSGYGEIKQDSDIVKNSANSANKNVSLPKDKQAPDKPKGVKEMTQTPQSSAGVKKMKAPGEPKKVKLKENQDKGLTDNEIYDLMSVVDDKLSFEQIRYYYRHPSKIDLNQKLTPQEKKELKDLFEKNSNLPENTQPSLMELMGYDENPFQDDEDSPFFKPTEGDINMDGVDPYDMIEYLEMELRKAESPEQKAEIEAKIKALEAGLEDLDLDENQDKKTTEIKIRDILTGEDYKLTQQKDGYLLRYKFWKPLPADLKSELEKVCSVTEHDDFGDEELTQYAYTLK